MDNFSDIYITLKGAKKLDSYGTQYEKYVDKVTNKIKKVAPAMEQKRYEEIVDVANEEIQSAQEKINKNYKKYEKGLKKAEDVYKRQTNDYNTVYSFNGSTFYIIYYMHNCCSYNAEGL